MRRGAAVAIAAAALGMVADPRWLGSSRADDYATLRETLGAHFVESGESAEGYARDGMRLTVRSAIREAAIAK